MSPRRRIPRGALLAAALLAPVWAASAQEVLAIPDAETFDPPTIERLHDVEGLAATQGWASVAAPLHGSAIRAFRQNRFIAADAWFHAYEWAAEFSEPENLYVKAWVDAVVAAGVNYAGVAGVYKPTARPLGAAVTPATQAWLLEHEAFAQEFFSDLNQVDYLPRVLAILDGLRQADPATFERFQSLALAIALVYDVPPPPYWPHSQVSEASLPRKLPTPAEPFERLTRDEALGRTYFRLESLRADELKFVVDAAAPAPELRWAQENVAVGLDHLEDAYDMVAYRTDRFTAPIQATWKEGPYTLQAIRTLGGICVDQAYFASEVGKARGVPTLFFAGSGQDGHHAWFGFLDAERHWRLDAGRYAEQRFVTGSALDPQTWRPISDHELQFLSERFRALPSFAQSRVQEEFARDFLGWGDAAAAAQAARTAVNYERRNFEAWDTLAAADARMGAAPAVQEAVLREAALAFTPKYPDLVRYFGNRVCASLRSRGETSLADYEERGIAERLKGDRADLAILQAQAILARSISVQSLPAQIGTYNAILSQFGPGSGTMFFDVIVTGFAEHLAQARMKAQAREAVERARQVLGVQPGTQAAMDVDKLMEQLAD
jgi:hypothetical protein